MFQDIPQKKIRGSEGEADSDVADLQAVATIHRTADNGLQLKVATVWYMLKYHNLPSCRRRSIEYGTIIKAISSHQGK